MVYNSVTNQNQITEVYSFYSLQADCTCTGIMVTCWLKVSVWVLDAAVVSVLTG